MAAHDESSLTRPLRTLPPEVVERIAAGEVIERPASAVRELIENALDARTRSIAVEADGAGMRQLRVADSGEGIAQADLEMALRPHTTSKLERIEDLGRLATFGFRGEALASLVALSDVDIVSKAGQEEPALRVSTQAGTVVSRGQEARSTGTTVTVRGLLQYAPARRAKLLTSRLETERLMATVRGYALAHPQIQFTVILDGRVTLHTPGGRVEDAVAAIYGADVAASLQRLPHMSVGGTQVTGWLGSRAFTQSTRGHLIVTVNGRPIANRALLAAIEQGYRPLLHKGRHPICVIAIQADPGDVDVNVHPAKLEVLLRDERAIGAALREAVHDSLGSTPVRAVGPEDSTASYARPRQPTLVALRRKRTLIREPRPLFVHEHMGGEQHSLLHELGTLEPLGQVDRSLIVAASPRGDLYLIDQHRAHERWLYDMLATHFMSHPSAALGRGHGTVGQLLLDPLVVELTESQAIILGSRLHELAALGLLCEPFGGSTFLVRALPSVPTAAHASSAFAADLAGDASEDGEDWREHLRVSLACRSALRRGEDLSLAEQRTLLDNLGHASARATCPHGSPIVLRWTHERLTRAFEW